MIFIYLMAGGSGSRLWPLSETTPKPLLELLPSGKTILEETISRIKTLNSETKIILGINKNHKKLFVDFLRKKKIENIDFLIEPSARDTAAAIIYLSYCLDNGEFGSKKDDVILATPCDQVLKDNSAFARAIEISIPSAKEGNLTTIGIKPSHPTTQYGYIKYSKEISNNVFKVESFFEKPNKKDAQKYMDSGLYWNSGTFVFSAKKMIEKSEKFCPEILNSVKKVFEISKNKTHPDNSFKEIPKISFDYAIAEKDKEVTMTKCDTEWRDLGNWKEIIDFFQEKGEIKNLNFEEYIAKNNAAISEKKVVFLGTEDLIVIDGPNGILIANRDSTTELKKYIKNTKSDI